jgi:hypothetical protein
MRLPLSFIRAIGINKIARKLGIGTSVVQRVVSADTR